jgi:hypothetical protein
MPSSDAAISTGGSTSVILDGGGSDGGAPSTGGAPGFRDGSVDADKGPGDLPTERDGSPPLPDLAGDLGAAAARDAGPSIGESRVLLLHMEELLWDHTANEVVDDSGSANHGTAVGTATTTADGRIGRGGAFDGAGSVTVLDSASLDATNALTMAVWIYPTLIETGGAKGIISKRTGYGDGTAYGMYLNADGKLYVDIDMENNRFAANTVFAIDNWYHVAVVYDGTLPDSERVRVYVNGTLDRTAPEDSASIANYASNLNIGVLPQGGASFVGKMDEVSIWTRALSATEIVALAAASGPI